MAAITTLPPERVDESVIGATVMFVAGPNRGITPPPDLVVLRAHRYRDPDLFRPWVVYERVQYELQWPDGGTTWHSRREFDPIMPGK